MAATRTTLEEGVHQLADTVRNSLNFYRTQEGAENVERAIVTGPAIAIPGFVDKLAEQLKLPAEPAFVMVDSEQAELDPSRLAVAAGLAIEDRVEPPRHVRGRSRAVPSQGVPTPVETEG